MVALFCEESEVCNQHNRRLWGLPQSLLTTVALQNAAARAGPQGNNNETHVGLPGKFHTGRLRLFFRNLEGLGMGLEQMGRENGRNFPEASCQAPAAGRAAVWGGAHLSVCVTAKSGLGKHKLRSFSALALPRFLLFFSKKRSHVRVISRCINLQELIIQ